MLCLAIDKCDLEIKFKSNLSKWSIRFVSVLLIFRIVIFPPFEFSYSFFFHFWRWMFLCILKGCEGGVSRQKKKNYCFSGRLTFNFLFVFFFYFYSVLHVIRVFNGIIIYYMNYVYICAWLWLAPCCFAHIEMRNRKTKKEIRLNFLYCCFLGTLCMSSSFFRSFDHIIERRAAQFIMILELVRVLNSNWNTYGLK